MWCVPLVWVSVLGVANPIAGPAARKDVRTAGDHDGVGQQSETIDPDFDGDPNPERGNAVSHLSGRYFPDILG